jgi:hypothetical protein
LDQVEVCGKIIVVIRREGKYFMENKGIVTKPFNLKNGPRNDEKKSIIFWLLISFVTLFLFWAPFQKALFNGNTVDFERPIYSALVWISIIMFLLAIYFIYSWSLITFRDVMSIFVWLLPICYLLSTFSSASSYFSANMLYIEIMYTSFFILGSYLSRNKIGSNFIELIFLFSGYIIVLFGIFHWLGNGKYIYNLFKWLLIDVDDNSSIYRDAVMGEEINGIRLTSVFQYANAYAAYLIALLFSTIFMIIKSKKWYFVVIHSLMIVPILVSFMLTLSRGALVILPIIALIILFFFKLHRQFIFLSYFLLAIATSFAILSKINNIGVEHFKNPSNPILTGGWTVLIFAALGFTVIVVFVQLVIMPLLKKYLDRWENYSWVNLILPLTAIIVGIVGISLLFSDSGFKNMLPQNIKQRVENINFAQNSVLERGTFYKDAIKLSKDYPVFGAGGGAWSALYEKYQNNPYVSRQAHNFFLQYLVEVGIVGLSIFIIFLVLIYYCYIRNYFKSSNEDKERHFIFFIVTISLLFHSIIDFDMSYVYLSVLLLFSLGAMASNVQLNQKALLRQWLDKVPQNNFIINKTYPILLLVLSIIMFFITVRLLSANSSFKEFTAVTHTSNDYNTITKPLNEAIKLHPNHPNYVLQKVGILFQVYNQTKDEKFYAEAQQLLNGLKAAEPNNRQRVAQQIYAYQIKNQLDKAADLAASELVNFPWDITLYEDTINLKVQLGAVAKIEKKALDQNWNSVLEVYNTVLLKTKYLETLPGEQQKGRVFNVTNKIALGVTQIYLLRGDYVAASNLLKPFVTDQLDDAINRSVARWYLAALHKQKLNDQPLYDKLIAKDANEKQQIETIVTMN